MWLKKAEDIKSAYLNGDFSSKRKKLRAAGYPEVEEALLKWFKTARDHNVPISGPFMMQRAGELAVKLGIPKGEFKCSNGWLEHFKECHGISFKRICGEEKSVDTESDQMDEWHRSLSMIMKEYTPDHIYNANKTGIFFRCMPDKMLEFKNIDCQGGKQSKERITGLSVQTCPVQTSVRCWSLASRPNPGAFRTLGRFLQSMVPTRKPG